MRFIVFALLLTSACTRDTEQKRLILTGSSTVAPIAMEIAKRFESEHPGVRVDVQMGGSSRGIADARKGLADIGMVSRALNSTETDLQAHTIAQDGIAIIVHAKNPITGLSRDQVKAVFTGQTVNWSNLDVSNAPITVVSKAAGRSTLELFLKHFQLHDTDIKAHVIIGDNEQGIRTVSGNPYAIGYVSIGAGEHAAQNGVQIKLIPVDGVVPSTQSVRDGKFPFSRPLNLVTKGTPNGIAQAFISFAKSPMVHDLIKQQYFVPPKP